MCRSEGCCNLKLLYMSVGLSLYVGTIVSIKLKPMLGDNVAESLELITRGKKQTQESAGPEMMVNNLLRKIMSNKFSSQTPREDSSEDDGGGSSSDSDGKVLLPRAVGCRLILCDVSDSYPGLEISPLKSIVRGNE